MNAKCSLAIAFGLAAPVVAQGEFSGLGFYDGKPRVSYGYDVSDDGHYVVGIAAADDKGNFTAFVWDRTTGKKTELVQRSAGYASSVAYSISGAGAFVGLAQGTTELGSKIAFRWKAGAYDLVGDIAGGTEDSRLWAMSGDGSAGTGIGDIDFGAKGQAFRWTASGGVKGLGWLSGDNYSIGLGMSADGKMIVGASGKAGKVQAMKWTESDGMVGLGDLAGGEDYSEAYGCSDDGKVIVGVGYGPKGYEAFKIYGEGAMEGIKDFIGKTDYSTAYATNHDGSVIVGMGDYDFTTGLGEAALWDASGIRRVKDVIEQDYGVDLSGWTLLDARSVSPDGSFICGTGINPAGEREAWYFSAGGAACKPDCNKDGKLNINDFICMQAKWRARDPYGDYDGSGTYTVNDFIRFQGDFVKGCQ